MFVILLKFAANRGQAGAFMAGHNDWLRRGFDDGVFVLAGSLQPAQGGALFAHGESRAEIEARLALDPFVAEGIVSAEIHEIAPARTDPRLAFLVS